MIYNNLLLYLTAIFLVSVDSVPDKPMLSDLNNILLFLVLLLWFTKFVRSTYAKPATFSASGYFSAEKKLSILALIFFGATLHLCDAKYYLSFLSLGERFPALVNIGGLALLLLFFALIWRTAHHNYSRIFPQERSRWSFIRLNIKTNLPIILPWIVLSLLYDLAALAPWPWLQDLTDSPWGDLAFFGFFLLFVLLFFPPLVRRLWGCEPLADGPLKEELTSFCAKQHFKADLYLWPLFEGRVPTAAVMGIVPGLRYILITPALIESMSGAEMEAVMAHEIGHVKYFHMLLYLLLIGGFSLFAGVLSEPALYFVLSRDVFYTIIEKTHISLENGLTLLGAVPLLLIMLLYFRFLFGYFIRNFERQADLFSFSALGGSSALVAAFERLAVITGTSKDQPSWHHFSLGQRIDFLQQCETDRGRARRHHQKVYISLFFYLLLLATGAYWANTLPQEQLISQYEEKYTEAIITKKIAQEPNNPAWLRLSGDLLLHKKLEGKAIAAYAKALELEPANPEIMNNLAWLLLTCNDLNLRDPARALTLARTAVTLLPHGFILDTLATAFWANTYLEEAIITEARAIATDPGKRSYYQKRMNLFQQHTYQESLKDQEE